MSDLTGRALAHVFRLRLLGARVHTRAQAEALSVDERDRILHVAAWSGIEDDAWQQALERLED